MPLLLQMLLLMHRQLLLLHHQLLLGPYHLTMKSSIEDTVDLQKSSIEDTVDLQQSSIDEVHLQKSIEDADLQKSSIEDAVDLQQSSIDEVDLQKSIEDPDLQKSSIEDADLQKSSIDEADLQKSAIDETSLRNITLASKSPLREVDLSGQRPPPRPEVDPDSKSPSSDTAKADAKAALLLCSSSSSPLVGRHLLEVGSVRSVLLLSSSSPARASKENVPLARDAVDKSPGESSPFPLVKDGRKRTAAGVETDGPATSDCGEFTCCGFTMAVSAPAFSRGRYRQSSPLVPRPRGRRPSLRPSILMRRSEQLGGGRMAELTEEEVEVVTEEVVAKEAEEQQQKEGAGRDAGARRVSTQKRTSEVEVVEVDEDEVVTKEAEEQQQKEGVGRDAGTRRVSIRKRKSEVVEEEDEVVTKEEEAEEQQQKEEMGRDAGARRVSIRKRKSLEVVVLEEEVVEKEEEEEVVEEKVEDDDAEEEVVVVVEVVEKEDEVVTKEEQQKEGVGRDAGTRRVSIRKRKSLEKEVVVEEEEVDDVEEEVEKEVVVEEEVVTKEEEEQQQKEGVGRDAGTRRVSIRKRKSLEEVVVVVEEEEEEVVEVLEEEVEDDDVEKEEVEVVEKEEEVVTKEAEEQQQKERVGRDAGTRRVSIRKRKSLEKEEVVVEEEEWKEDDDDVEEEEEGKKGAVAPSSAGASPFSFLLPPRKLKKGRKGRVVSFGIQLSPELFDKTLPPSTPLRRGASPVRTPRARVSTPACGVIQLSSTKMATSTRTPVRVSGRFSVSVVETPSPVPTLRQNRDNDRGDGDDNNGDDAQETAVGGGDGGGGDGGGGDGGGCTLSGSLAARGETSAHVAKTPESHSPWSGNEGEVDPYDLLCTPEGSGEMTVSPLSSDGNLRRAVRPVSPPASSDRPGVRRVAPRPDVVATEWWVAEEALVDPSSLPRISLEANTGTDSAVDAGAVTEMWMLGEDDSQLLAAKRATRGRSKTPEEIPSTRMSRREKSTEATAQHASEREIVQVPSEPAVKVKTMRAGRLRMKQAETPRDCSLETSGGEVNAQKSPPRVSRRPGLSPIAEIRTPFVGEKESAGSASTITQPGAGVEPRQGTLRLRTARARR
ncbi:unnamed protein product [Lampetra planeri]